MNTFQAITSTPDNEPVPTMLPIKKVASLTNLSYHFIRKLCIANKIVYVRTGCKYLINYEKFLEFLNTGN